MKKLVQVTHSVFHRTCGEPQCCDYYDLNTTIEYNDNTFDFHGHDGQQSEAILSWIAQEFNLDFKVEEEFTSEDDD